MQRLSAVVIAQNEEENLPDCIRSLSFADEVLICDGGSEDKSVEVAEALGATVYHRTFDGFSAQKNFIVAQAKGPWIISLDADERVSPELRKEIEDLLSSDSAHLADGYRVPRRNYFGDTWVRHGGWWPDYNLRLFKKNAGRFVTRQVHESLKVVGRVETLAGAIDHRTYQDLADFITRMNRYSSLGAQQSFEEGKVLRLGDMTLRPFLAFLKMFVLRRGFLDGTTGFQLAVIHGMYTYSKYAKLRELIQGR
jgi:glycosyltransferase involved in cell wall biosynthesis